MHFYRWTHLWTALGAALGTGVLVGALVVGDSVRESLRRLNLLRLGGTHFALDAGDRYVRSALADELAKTTGGVVAPVVRVAGLAVNPDTGRRLNQIQILGVDRQFGALSVAGDTVPELKQGDLWLNERAANTLVASPGDTVVIRLDRPGILPREAPLSTVEDRKLALRCRVAGILSDDQGGRFSLRASQISPHTVLLQREWLAAKLGRPGRANLLLAAPGNELTCDLARLAGALEEHLSLTDAALTLREVPEHKRWELRSDSVFISSTVTRAALAPELQAETIFTYFVDAIATDTRTTPYSFVAGVEEETVGIPLGNGDIAINDWLAKDLRVTAGQPLRLSYRVFGPMRTLEERSVTLNVRAVLPLKGRILDPGLMPAFPGLAETESCTEWRPGLPIDTNQIRPEDEAYWTSYKGTPKAFVSLPTARELWGNQYGECTAIRFPTDHFATAQELERDLLSRLTPEDFDLAFLPVRAQALAASRGSTDFGQLFLGLSFFIIVAAIMLTGLMFGVMIDQRQRETGLLLAVGFAPRQVRRMLMGEGLILALAGVAGGIGLGVAYSYGVLQALCSVWQGAVRTADLIVDVRISALTVGALTGLASALLAMWITAKKHSCGPIHALQNADAGNALGGTERTSRVTYGAGACLVAAIAIVAATDPGTGKESAGAFFGAGALMLTGCLATCWVILAGRRRHRRAPRRGLVATALGRLSANPGRSVGTIALVACGIFLVTAVAANRHDPLKSPHKRASGTGGFAFFAETTLPLLDDLNALAHQRSLGLGGLPPKALSVVPLRIRDGDDASCANLNRVQQPALAGVVPAELDSRGAFTFTKQLHALNGKPPWSMLEDEQDDGAIPGVADYNVIVWSLGKSVGDTIPYTDEQGRPFNVRLVAGLANSILQGYVLISDRHFRERFPSVEGTRALLIDVPQTLRDTVERTLTDRLADLGILVTAAEQRMADIARLEDTYLTIFLVLGGLGLVLGSVGLGALVLKTVEERRGELALLRALGFSRVRTVRLLLLEHVGLLVLGIVCGALSAGLAVLPAVVAPGGTVPYAAVALLIAGILGCGTGWIVAAGLLSTRGPFLEALREE